MTAEMLVGEEALAVVGEFEWSYALQTRYEREGYTTEWITIHPDRLLDKGLARHQLRVYRRTAEPWIHYRAVRRPVGEMEVVDW